MSKMVGYMVTWTTYGSWLPGDLRGYVEDGKILGGNVNLLEYSKKTQKKAAVKLNKRERAIVRQVIEEQAERAGQVVDAVVVCSNHVHVLGRPCGDRIEKIVKRYKSMATRALWGCGRKEKVWSVGFDKRFCFSEEEMAVKKNYILKHTG